MARRQSPSDPNQAFEEAERRIAQEAAEKTGALNLSVQGLERVPDLQSVKHIEWLDLDGTEVSDLSPLSTLESLQSLDLDNTQVSDLSPLSALESLQSLHLNDTQVSDLSPLSTLESLQSLHLNDTQVSDLSPLSTLESLQSLSLWSSKVSDLSPLSDLTNLQSLDLDDTQVSDLSPLEGKVWKRLSLRNLGSVTGLDHTFFKDNFSAPSSEAVDSERSPRFSFEGTYPANIASDFLRGLEGQHLLQALLDHSRSKTQLYSDIKAVLLGNGQVGKTSLIHALRGKRGMMCESTHGIDVSYFDLEKDLGLSKSNAGSTSEPPGQIHLWDFGGQDLYHETHRHFMKQAGIYILAWNPASEAADHHVINGDRFPNHKLRYWLELIERYSRENAQILIVQTQADRYEHGELSDETKSFLDELRERKRIGYQVLKVDFLSTNRIENAKQTFLDAAITARRAFNDQLPKGFKTALQAFQEKCAEATKTYLIRDPQAAESPDWLMSRPAFDEFCAEMEEDTRKRKFPFLEDEDNRSSFLRVLTNSGLVIHDPKSLEDPRLVVARQWLLEPIYALLDRRGPYGYLKIRQGIFRHPDVERFWDKKNFSKDQRKLALAFMAKNGLLITDWQSDGYYLGAQHPTYILPKLLPEKPPQALEEIWEQTEIDSKESEVGPPFEEAVINCQHSGEFMLHDLQALMGARYGARLIYWRSGLAYRFGDWLLRWQLHQGDTGYELRLWTGGAPSASDHEDHLADLALHLSEDHQTFYRTFEKYVKNATNRAFPKRSERSLSTEDKREDLNPLSLTPEQETKLKTYLKKQTHDQIQPAVPFHDVFISYAWGDEQKADGRRHSLLIDAVEQVLIAKGFKVLRDRNENKLGHSLRNFMHAAVDLFDTGAARAKHILLILDDKYFHSPNCMFEFMTLWQNSGEDLQMFREHTTVINEGARYFRMEERQEIATRWLEYAEKIHDGRKPNTRDRDAPLALSPRDQEFLDLIKAVAPRLPEILEMFSDVITPRKLTDLVEIVQDWTPHRKTQPAA